MCADCSNTDTGNFNPDECVFGLPPMCNDNEEQEFCMACDEDQLCCIGDDCADCSEADLDNLNPDDCVEVDDEDDEDDARIMYADY